MCRCGICLFGRWYIRKHPVRSSLTAFQVMLGVAAIALIFNVIFVLWEGVQDTERMMGGSVYQLRVGVEVVSDSGYTYLSPERIISLDDFEVFRSEIEAIEYVTPIETYNGYLLKVNDLLYEVSLVGYVGPDFLKVTGLDMVSGTFFTEADYEESSNVCVVAKQVESRLYPDGAVGKTAVLYRTWSSGELRDPEEYTIIGVYDQGSLVEAQSDVVGNLFLMPASVEVKRFKSSSPDRDVKFMKAMLRIKPGALGSVHAALSGMVKGLYGDKYEVDLTAANRHLVGHKAVMPLVMSALGGFGLLIVAISPIGILTTMMVNVVERTREFGVKKALGARKGHLVLEVTAEAVLVAFGGGVLGILLAYVLSGYIFNAIEMIPIVFEPGLHPMAILMSLIVALFSGWIFGAYPAMQAIRLQVTEALRES